MYIEREREGDVCLAHGSAYWDMGFETLTFNICEFTILRTDRDIGRADGTV